MKIREVITELEVKPYEKQVIDTGNVETLLRQFCPAYDNLLVTPIWRGFKNHDEAVLKIDPGTGIRQSQNTTNYYTELLDHNPYYKDWPQRSRSLICTTEHNRAYSYRDIHVGGVYALFPGRGAHIAICSGHDIWEAEAYIPFFGGHVTFPDLNYYLHELGLPSRYEGMVNVVKNKWFKDNLEIMCRNMETKAPDPATFLPQIMEGMAPAVVNFDLMSVEDYAGSGIHGREMWIGDPVIIVREAIFNELLEKRTSDL